MLSINQTNNSECVLQACPQSEILSIEVSLCQTSDDALKVYRNFYTCVTILARGRTTLIITIPHAMVNQNMGVLFSKKTYITKVKQI